ncbi:MAG: hypothetical protein CL489_03445 [Acidobacteria bacterium]|nr:hypothetical protein [Acidobacteriota bacterium]|tara:strand:+ start:1438 stop:2067 length:630 start_codon:yes stop_codon:yes gene_type:complete
MANIDKRVLPDKIKEEPKEKIEDKTPSPSSEKELEKQPVKEEIKETVPLATHLDRINSLKDDMRELKYQLKERDRELQDTSTVSTDDYSESERELKKNLTDLQDRIDSMTVNQELQKLEDKFPALADKRDEFEEFRKTVPGVSMDKVAKLYLVENDLLDTKPTRKGLEAPTGGGVRDTSPPGYSDEELKDLRTSQPRKYLKLIQQGKIK